MSTSVEHKWSMWIIFEPSHQLILVSGPWSTLNWFLYTDFANLNVTVLTFLILFVVKCIIWFYPTYDNDTHLKRESYHHESLSLVLWFVQFLILRHISSNVWFWFFLVQHQFTSQSTVNFIHLCLCIAHHIRYPVVTLSRMPRFVVFFSQGENLFRDDW